MKQQHVIYQAGAVIGLQTAKSPQRAIALFAAKRGGNAQSMTACATVSSDKHHQTAKDLSVLAS